MSLDLVTRVVGSGAALLAALTVLAAGGDPLRSAPAVAGFLAGGVWAWTPWGRTRPYWAVALLAGGLVAAPAATGWLPSVVLAVLATTALFATLAPARAAALSSAVAVAGLLAATVVLPAILAPISLDPVLPGHAAFLAVAGGALLAFVLFLRPEVSP